VLKLQKNEDEKIQNRTALCATMVYFGIYCFALSISAVQAVG
jgi:hypothetical protein